MANLTDAPAPRAGRLQDDCFRPGDPRLTHAQALAILKSRVKPVTATEPMALDDAAGRTLAEAIIAPSPVPLHTNAAVDGYAFAASAETRDGGARLRVVGRAAAGHPFTGHCPPGSAIRIFTGAVIPDGADTCAMQEDVRVEQTPAGEAFAHVPAGLKPGANVRKAGEDLALGRMLFEPGHILRPQDLAALASVGKASVSCHARVKVGIVSSGDEVLPPGKGPLVPGQVYDANASMLVALAKAAGAEVKPLGIWPDRREAVVEGLAAAAREFDVVLTTGGASLGEEDHMAAALSSTGTRHLWQLAIKPGRPMMFGQIRGEGRDCVVVGLPGNPVAVFVCFLMYVHPMLRALGGASWREPRRFMLPAAFSFSGRKTGRREFWRGMLVERDGVVAVEKFARDGSGLISGLTAADGLIDIPEGHGDVAQGDLVPFIPFGEFLIA